MSLKSDNSHAEIDATLAHYDASALAFQIATRDHDVSQNIDALIRHIEGEPPFDILDVGCGPGRDVQVFLERGHRPVGLDGAANFVALARAACQAEIWHQNFLTLDLPAAHFDGVFANASLFHVPTQALPRVLLELRATLRPGGVLFSSNPRGQNQEGLHNGRYGVFHDLVQWRRYMENAGFEALEHYYRPAGQPRNQQPWLATIWRSPRK
jgi:SAM-dependent methyltransferase